VQYIIAFVAVIISGYYFVSWYMRGKLLTSDKRIEDTPV